jgi:carbonic anhydrase
VGALPRGRRQFLKLAGLAGGAALFGLAAPRIAGAAGHADALLLSCIDYRLLGKVSAYMAQRGLADKYDHVILAGASLGAVTDAFPDWGRTFWEHLGVAIDLHDIKRVVVMDHRDCGAYKVILHKDLAGDPPAERTLHAEMLNRLGGQIHDKHPKLEVELLLMALDGQVDKIA